MKYVKNAVSKNAMLIVLLLTMLFFELLLGNAGRGSLFSPQNLTNLIGQNGYVVILAIGMLLCILTGGNIDLAVGSIVILVGAFAGIFIVNWGLNPYLSIIMCLALGTFIGAWQAFWIAYMRIPAFIVTLTGMLTFRGLALLLMDSRNIGPFPIEYRQIFNSFIPSRWSDNPEFIFMFTYISAIVISVLIMSLKTVSYIQKKRKGYSVGNFWTEFVPPALVCTGIVFVFERLGRHNGIPATLVLLGILFIVYNYFTQNTILGRYFYAMGGNAKAARLSGINTKKTLFIAYANNGFLAAIAALVVVARFNQAGTQAGMGYELDAIAACFIGGASAYGGIGKVGGVVIGAIFMGVLNMGMSLLGADQNLQRVIKGLVLLSAVVFDVYSKNRKQIA